MFVTLPVNRDAVLKLKAEGIIEPKQRKIESKEPLASLGIIFMNFSCDSLL